MSFLLIPSENHDGVWSIYCQSDAFVYRSYYHLQKYAALAIILYLEIEKPSVQSITYTNLPRCSCHQNEAK